MNFGSIQTVGGYAMGEVASAFQKAIRRGQEEDALFWLNEMMKTGQPELPHGYSNYAWKRVRIIASEDIGPAEPMLPAVLQSLFNSWELGVKESKERARAAEKDGKSYEKDHGALFLVHAVILACRAKKSRVANNALLLLVFGGLAKRPIPDYALDQHTGKGRRIGRGIVHFIEEASLIENVGLPDPYEERVREIMTRDEKKTSGGRLPGRQPPSFVQEPETDFDKLFE